MTKPDAALLQHRIFAGLAVGFTGASAGAAYVAVAGAPAVFDVWLCFASVVTGVAAIGNTIGAIACRMIYVDEMRSN